MLSLLISILYYQLLMQASFVGYMKSWMLNGQDFSHSLFDRLPYRYKSDIVTATHDFCFLLKI